MKALWIGFLLASLSVSGRAYADDELQKKLANPAADLVTLPLQYTGTFNTGPLESTQHTVNFQPVYPLKLNRDVLMINRAIVPLVSNPAFATDEDRATGLGDITYEALFSPAVPGKVIWGVGPIVMLDTATDRTLGSGKWSAGPVALVLAQPGKWSIGALATQVWSFAGSKERAPVSLFTLQPILSYRLSPIHSIGYLGTISSNWKEHGDGRWTVPIGASYTWLVKPEGFVPLSIVFGGGYNVIRPDSAGDWFVRFQISFVLPK